MENFPLAIMIGTRAALREVHSALPDAPVVPDRPRRPGVTVRSRTALARRLERLADAVAPTPPACTPAH
jgi:hypothetical protein